MQLQTINDPRRKSHEPNPVFVQPTLARIAVDVARPSLAQVLQLTPTGERARVVVVGCAGDGNWYDSFKNKVMNCLTPDMRAQIGGGRNRCGTDENGNNCREDVVDTAIGLEDVDAKVADEAFEAIVQLDAMFWPMLISCDDEVARLLRISKLKYGPQDKLISDFVGGSNFSNQNTVGGYRMPADKWLTAGQKITIAGKALGVIAAGQLILDVAGFTPA